VDVVRGGSNRLRKGDDVALDLFAGIPVTDYVHLVGPGTRRNALVMSFVDRRDNRVAEIARRGIEPNRRDTYESGVTTVTYRDADGNEISLGGVPS
jgi:hypothetical protein